MNTDNKQDARLGTAYSMRSDLDQSEMLDD